MDHDAHLTQDARRQAVANALAWAPGLVRYAARYTHSIEDAEDAYQCAMEIALTKAPSADRRDFTNWLHKVVRREALRIRECRDRECPTDDYDMDGHLGRDAEHVAGPQAVVEWRERYRSMQDGLYGLSRQKRVCLMLRSAGLQHPEIADMLGISVRAVARDVCEARAELRAFELRLASGEECTRATALMDLVIDGEAQPSQVRTLERHTKHCPSCREAFRSSRQQGQLVASLVPLGLVASTDLMQSRPPDPTAVVGWWDRLSGSASVKAGNAMQLWLDLPQLMSSKAGAGALVAAAAGAIGAPMVVQSMRAEGTPGGRTQIAVTAPPALSPAMPTLPPATPVTPARRVVTTPPPAKHAATHATTARTSYTPRAASAPRTTIVRTAVRSTTPIRRSVPAPAAAGSASSEFAP